MTPTDAILAFATGGHTLPPQARADAVRLLADTLAVGAAGAVSGEAAKLYAAMDRWGHDGDARLLSGGTHNSASAAFFNGFAIHCLEWDAVHEPAVVHALSVVTAALLAASDRAGGSKPDEFLLALAIGVDVAAGLGLSATGPMTFFRPATAGVIGAALAVARLDCLPDRELRHAMGLAYSFAAGTMQAHVEASIALPLQIGNAARAALTAVDLARAGMDGPRDVLTGPFGYHALIEPLDLDRYLPTLGKIWRISEVSIKPFPSGRASHGALGALQDLRAEGLVAPDNVARVELFAPPLIHRLVGRHYDPGKPMSHNRLCLEFLAPHMLVDGVIDPRKTETLMPLADKVRVTVDDNPDGNALSPQRLVVTLTDGQVVERAIPATLGSPAAPLSPAQAAAKAGLCRELAPDADPRLFADPLAYATEPR